MRGKYGSGGCHVFFPPFLDVGHCCSLFAPAPSPPKKNFPYLPSLPPRAVPTINTHAYKHKHTNNLTRASTHPRTRTQSNTHRANVNMAGFGSSQEVNHTFAHGRTLHTNTHIYTRGFSMSVEMTYANACMCGRAYTLFPAQPPTHLRSPTTHAHPLPHPTAHPLHTNAQRTHTHTHTLR